MTLGELATRLGCRLEGDGRIEVTRVAGLEDAGPGDLTFLANPKYASKVHLTRASAIIGDNKLAAAPCAILRTPEVYLTFARAVGLLAPRVAVAPGISPLAAIDPSAELGPGVSVGAVRVHRPGVPGRRAIDSASARHARAWREPVARSASCTPEYRFAKTSSLGRRVIVQNGAVIGSDGYGFARRPDGSHEKIPQVGRVVVEDDVEIGANTTVDRPAVGETRIGAGTKIDNLVQVAHGVKIGRDVLLAAQVGIAGSTDSRRPRHHGGAVWRHGPSCASGAGAIVGGQSAVTKDIAAGEHVAGMPAVDVAEWREAAVLVRRLPEMRRALAAMEARLAALESGLKRQP